MGGALDRGVACLAIVSNFHRAAATVSSMNEASALIEKFSSRRVLLIGDTILDIYVYGRAIGKSAETPTIVAEELETKVSLGGAFLVARNLLELGAHVSFVSLVGNDQEADYVKSFNHERLKTLLVCDASRRTTAKKRYWVDGYKLLQFDSLDNSPLSADLEKKAACHVREEIRGHDTVVVSDYRHGLLTPALIKSIMHIAKDAARPVFVDSQVSQAAANHLLYRGADTICLNLKEAKEIDPEFEPGDDTRCFSRLRDKLETERLIVKLGPNGCIAMIRGNFYHARALNVKAVDTCGAGDAFLAALCLGDLENPAASLAIANAWAGLSTQVYGPVPAAREDLVRAMAG